MISTLLRGAQTSRFGETEVSSWDHIVAIDCGGFHTVGLRSNGTAIATNVLVANRNHKQGDLVSTWKDLTAVSANWFHTLGLKRDGTVVACGDNSTGRCNVGEWKGIVAIAACGDRSFGLRSDGTVVMTAFTSAVHEDVFKEAETEIAQWRDIIFLSAGVRHIVALSKNGIVLAAGVNSNGQCDVSGWKNIVAISSGTFHTLGLRADGTVISTNPRNLPGRSSCGQTDVNNWKLFKTGKELAQERLKRIDALNKESENLNKEMSTLKGMFASSRAAKIKARLLEIETERKRLG